MSLRLRYGLALALAVGCGKEAKPDADLGWIRQTFHCPAAPGRAQVERDRCRVIEDFSGAGRFDSWPEGEALDVWIGWQHCGDAADAYGHVVRVKRGAALESTVKINHLERFEQLPFVTNDGGGNFDVMRGAVKGPPFSPAIVSEARRPLGADAVYFPLMPAGASVAAPNEHWRSIDGRLLVVSSQSSSVSCVAELWKAP
jgi:hypothetical protein